MTLHPHITQTELDHYCRLAHEHRIRTVRVDPPTYQRIKQIAYNNTSHQGIQFRKNELTNNNRPHPKIRRRNPPLPALQ